eukprot:gene3812-4399_t
MRSTVAYIVVPENAPKIKLDAIRGYGAEVTLCTPTLAARESNTNTLIEKHGCKLVHPYDNADVIAGQGTIAIELLSQVDQLDAIMCPIGGGGVLSGICIAAKSINPNIKVFACEPLGADDASRSMAADAPQPLPHLEDKMMSEQSKKLFSISALLLVCCCLVAVNAAEDDQVISCGGFVKVSKSLHKNHLNYENIKINLLSASDNRVKESTDCAPNGYYFLPIYERGSYLLEIEGPNGWSFIKKQIPLSIQSANDCSDDINFELGGFRVEGRVSSIGCDTGAVNPALDGIRVVLRTKSDDTIVQETRTTAGGSYHFNSVVPSNDYIVVAHHDKWSFATNSIPVSFTWDNLIVEDDITVSGFDLQGRIGYDGEPMKNVDFHLYSSYNQPIVDCKPSASAQKTVENMKAVCTVQSGADGSFVFRNVPCGAYMVVPQYMGAETKYDIAPVHANIVMVSGGFEIKDAFKVMGFSVSGRVVNQQKAGVANVNVIINGSPKTTTDKDGYYTLEQVAAGSTYKIQAQKEHMTFESLMNFRMTPSLPSLPDIVVKTYALCGQVLVPTPPSNLKVNPREISVQSDSTHKVEKKMTDASGNYCFDVAPGTYTVSVSVSAQEKLKGLQFHSQSITTSIVNKPQLEIIFSQTRASVSGRVKLMKPITQGEVPSGLLVALQPTSRTGETVQATLSLSKSGDVAFKFRDLLPGTYRVSVSFDAWCWVNNLVEKTIDLTGTEERDDLEFVQSGFNYDVVSPHDQVSLVHQYGDAVKTVQLRKGVNEMCLSEAGTHKFTVKSCFQFEKDSYTFATDANQRGKLSLKIEKFQLSGTVQVPVGSSVTVQVFAKGDRAAPLAVLTPVATQDATIVKYSYMASLGDDVEFVPTSSNSDLLFYPHSRAASINAERCPPSLDPIVSRPGLFIRGQVFPNIEGVEITPYLVNGDKSGESAVSGSEGHYVIGPLYDDRQYTLKASKPGFHFKKESNSDNFKAIELGSLTVSIRDSASNSPVQGVLLSLSGEGYRSNVQSPVNGSIGFPMLFPGTYFVKSLLKEYSITPSSQTLEIIEGKETKVNLVAKRVAFSVFGNIRSLNNQPLAGATVQAIASGERVAEESSSDEAGNYRLRGLTPGQSYVIRVVGGHPGERAAPPSHTVALGQEDASSIDFVVVAVQPNTFELTGSVQVTGANTQLSKLRANLYNARDSSLHRSLELGFSTFFDFGAVPIGAYVLRVEGDARANVVASPAEVQIKDSDLSAVRHHTFKVESLRSASHSDHETVPYSGLIFFALVVAVVLYPYQMWNILVCLKNGEMPRLNKKSQFNHNSNGEYNDDDETYLPKDLLKNKSLKKKNKVVPADTGKGQLPLVTLSHSLGRSYRFDHGDIVHCKLVPTASLALQRLVLVSRDAASFEKAILCDTSATPPKQTTNFQANQEFRQRLIEDDVLFNQGQSVVLSDSGFQAIECFPLLQGCINSSTVIIILGPAPVTSEPPAPSSPAPTPSSPVPAAPKNLRISNFIIHPFTQAIGNNNNNNSNTGSTGNSSTTTSAPSPLFHFTPNSNGILSNNEVTLKQLTPIPSHLSLSLIDPTYDYLNDAIVSLATLKKYSLFHGASVKLQNLTTRRQTVLRVFSIMNLDDGALAQSLGIVDGPVFLPPLSLFNLGVDPKTSFQLALPSATPLLAELSILKPDTALFPTATRVRISRVMSATSSGHASYSTQLSDFFERPRVMKEGDLFTLPDAPNVFFRVDHIQPSAEADNGNLSLIDRTKTTMIQEGSSHSYLPNQMQSFTLRHESHQLEHIAYRREFQRITELILPFMHSFSFDFNCTLLLKGAQGVGKSTLLKQAANHLGLHLIEVDCFELYSFSEQEKEDNIRNALDNAADCAPFAATVRSTDDMSGQLRSWFKYEIELDAPDEPTRLGLLNYIFRGIPINNSVSLKNIAMRTASFLPSNLKCLAERSGMKALKRVSTLESLNIKPEVICNCGINIIGDDVSDAIAEMQGYQSSSIGAPKIPNVKWDDVGGLANVKSEIMDTIQLPLENPHLFASGIGKRSGILLYGPPGTGKTLLAKAIATECSLNFLSVKGPELINMYIGESEKNIREIFNKARQAKPCVIFFDELDSLAPARGNGADSGGVMDRVVSQLLAELDGMQKSSDVFIIGATNRPDLLDPALMIPGRLDRLLYLGISSDKESQLKIVKALTRKFHLGDDVDLKDAVDKCQMNLTGSDFYALCSDALANAIKEKIQELEEIRTKRRAEALANNVSDEIDEDQEESDQQVIVFQRHFLEAVDMLVPSVSQDEMAYYHKVQKQFSTKKK